MGMGLFYADCLPDMRLATCDLRLVLLFAKRLSLNANRPSTSSGLENTINTKIEHVAKRPSTSSGLLKSLLQIEHVANRPSTSSGLLKSVIQVEQVA